MPAWQLSIDSYDLNGTRRGTSDLLAKWQTFDVKTEGDKGNELFLCCPIVGEERTRIAEEEGYGNLVSTQSFRKALSAFNGT